MGPSQMLLKLFMDRAGIPLDLGTFERRFSLQKKTYLAQLAGLDMRYRFSWYLRGPYCRELTSDAFLLIEQINAGETDYKGFSLSPRAERRIQDAGKLWNRPDGVGCPDEVWLELLASLHYLKHIAYWPSAGPRTLNAVLGKLVRCKPHLSKFRRDAQAAWRHLDDLGLIDSKTLQGR